MIELKLESWPLDSQPAHFLLPPFDLHASVPGSLDSPLLSSCPWLRSCWAPDLLAEAAEDGEEPHDHVGQREDIGNIFPGNFIHLEVTLVFGQEETGALTCGPEKRGNRFQGQSPKRGS